MGTVSTQHSKINNIPDWLQTQLDTQIANGNYPQGTTLADIVLPSDWNDDHVMTGMDDFENAVKGIAIVDMASDNYTMTDAEARCSLIVILNGDVTKTLTIPATSFDEVPKNQIYSCAASSGPSLQLEGFGGSAITLQTAMTHEIAVSTASGLELLIDLNAQSGTYARRYSTDILKITSQALTVAAQAGEFEYLTNTPYFTPTTNNRGVIPSVHFVNNSSDVSLSDVNTAQALFGSDNDTLTVPSNTLYRFEANLYFTTGSTSHAKAFGFGGTATFDSATYFSTARVAGATNRGAAECVWVNAATATNLTIASTAIGCAIQLRGTIRITTGGTIIPQITFSSAPGGTNLCLKNSFFQLYPMGSDTAVAVGNWA